MIVKQLKKILDDYSDTIEVKIEVPEHDGGSSEYDIVRESYSKTWNELNLICE